jgi:hypothetical protein
MITGGAWSELGRVDLRRAALDNLDIPRLCLAHSNLDGASLIGANLTGATLTDTCRTDMITDHTTTWPDGFTPPHPPPPGTDAHPGTAH